MGIISVEHTDRLYWLGRYSERVYTTIRMFAQCYDTMIDDIEEEYDRFCHNLDIPNIYQSGEDFIERYCFDESDPNSIYSNLLRAYDNAIVLREEIGSETLSYIQLAIYEMQKAHQSQAPLIELQKVTDNIVAFWGIPGQAACQAVYFPEHVCLGKMESSVKIDPFYTFSGFYNVADIFIQNNIIGNVFPRQTNLPPGMAATTPGHFSPHSSCIRISAIRREPPTFIPPQKKPFPRAVVYVRTFPIL